MLTPPPSGFAPHASGVGGCKPRLRQVGVEKGEEMRTKLLSVFAALALVIGAFAASSAEAHHRHHGRGAAAVGGAILGLAVGSALARPHYGPRYYYAPPPAYYGPPRGYYHGPRYYHRPYYGPRRRAIRRWRRHYRRHHYYY